MAKRFIVIGLVVAAISSLTSCASLNSVKPVPASCDAQFSEPATAGAGESGWIARRIPGLKRLSDLLPPPTEARMEWDKRLKKRGAPWSEGGMGD